MISLQQESSYSPSTSTNYAPIASLESNSSLPGGNGADIVSLDISTDLLNSTSVQTNGCVVVENVTASNITFVRYRDRSFSLSESTNPVDGEFYFDYDNRKLILKDGRDYVEGLVFYSGGASGIAVRTDAICVPYDSFLNKWNIQSISRSHNFENHPQLTLEFEACKEDRAKIASELRGGSIVNVLGKQWIINGTPSTPLVSINSNSIKASVRLVGIHAPDSNKTRSPLDKKICFKQGKNIFQTTIGQMAAKNNLPYSGLNIPIRIPKNTDPSTVTTLREEVEKRKRTVLGFIDYSESSVQVRSFDSVPTHVIDDEDLLEDWLGSFDTPGWGTEFEGVPLAVEWRNRLIRLEHELDKTDQGITIEWSFEGGASDFFEVTIPAQPKGFTLVQPQGSDLQNIGLNFDAGGATKTARKETKLNGQSLITETWEYGYAYPTDEIYTVEGENNNQIVLSDTINPQDHWKEVRHSVEYWIYDSDGYLIEVIKEGSELARVKQESEALEAVSLQAQAQQAGLVTPEGAAFLQEQQEYQFTQTIPINDRTEHSLGLLRDYYDDLIKPPVPCEDVAEEIVEAKFSDRTIRTRTNLQVQPGIPEEEDAIVPPIVYGKYLKEITQQKITNTGTPERFETNSLQETAEGTYSRDAIAISSSTQNLGRPSIHTRINQQWDIEFNNPNYELYLGKQYYLDSPGITPEFRTPEGTISYPDIDNPNKAKEIAELEYAIAVSQASKTTSIKIFWRNGIKPGDKCLFQGKIYRIWDVRETRQILSAGKWKGSLTLKIGLWLTPSLQLEVIS